MHAELLLLEPASADMRCVHIIIYLELHILYLPYDPGLQRPVCEAKIFVYIPDSFIDYLHTVGSVGGGPDVINFEAQMYRGLLQLKWNVCHQENKIKEYEIEHQVVPVSLDSEGPSSIFCNGNTFQCYMSYLCPGYSYTFRIRSSIFSGWGRCTRPFTRRFDDFLCTISYINHTNKGSKYR